MSAYTETTTSIETVGTRQGGFVGRIASKCSFGAGRPDFRRFRLQTGTALHPTAEPTNFEFGVGDFEGDGRPDLYAINRRGGSGKTEVHVLSGASGYQSFSAHSASALHPTDNSNWAFVFSGAN